MRRRHKSCHEIPIRRVRRPLRPADPGSAARRLAWAVVGVCAFFVAAHGVGWW